MAERAASGARGPGAEREPSRAAVAEVIAARGADALVEPLAQLALAQAWAKDAVANADDLLMARSEPVDIWLAADQLGRDLKGYQRDLLAARYRLDLSRRRDREAELREKALWAFEHRVALNPDESGYTLMGDALWALGRVEEAKAAFVRALELDPRWDEAMFNLAMICREENPEKAKRLLSQAVSIDETVALYHRELGWQLSLEAGLESLECEGGRPTVRMDAAKGPGPDHSSAGGLAESAPVFPYESQTNVFPPHRGR